MDRQVTALRLLPVEGMEVLEPMALLEVLALRGLVSQQWVAPAPAMRVVLLPGVMAVPAVRVSLLELTLVEVVGQEVGHHTGSALTVERVTMFLGLAAMRPHLCPLQLVLVAVAVAVGQQEEAHHTQEAMVQPGRQG